MSDRLSINLRHFSKNINIKDSLELLDCGLKYKVTKQNHDHKDINYSSSDEEGYDILTQQDSINDDSSIEQTRDATTPLCQALSGYDGVYIELDRSNPINSTLVEDQWAAPISVYSHPLVSPIEEYTEIKVSKNPLQSSNKENFTLEKRGESKKLRPNSSDSSLTTSKSRSMKLLNRNTHKSACFEFEEQDEQIKRTAPDIISTDSDVEWIPNKYSLQLDKNNKEPVWLTQEPIRLKPISPRAYTPQKFEKYQLSLKKAGKQKKLRTSSPDDSKIVPKAKKSLIENLDLSSIVSDVEYYDSVELRPRPPTPGTVNSDEILPPDYTPVSLQGSAMNKQLFASDCLHVVISQMDQEMCDKALRNNNVFNFSVDDVVSNDVISCLPSPRSPRKSIHVKAIKNRQINGHKVFQQGRAESSYDACYYFTSYD